MDGWKNNNELERKITIKISNDIPLLVTATVLLLRSRLC